MAVWTAPSIWTDGECFILGGGPSMPRQFGVPEETIKAVMTGKQPASAYSEYLSPIHNKHVIGINNAYKIGDWLDALFFGDCGWYVVYRLALLELQCLKVTCCDRFANKSEKSSLGIKYLARNRKKTLGISEDPTTVCWNNNSGFAAISLAAHFGVKRIVLLGFDMTLDSSRVSHWHGSHHPQNKKPPIPAFARHMRGAMFIQQDAERLGIEVLNCSDISTLTEFKKVNLQDVL
jgi:hypothetical protein